MPSTHPISLSGQVALGGATFSLHETHDDDPVTVIQAAADAGVRIFDSARAYAPVGDPQHNELLLAHALTGRDNVLIATKGGHFRTGPNEWDIDNSPERLRRDVEDSLSALGVEQLGLYYLHRADGRGAYQGLADVREPITESVEALLELRRANTIARLGLSNVTVDQLEGALALGPVDAVQNHHSAAGRESADVLRHCEAHGIPFFAYSPLRGRGTGTAAATQFPRLGAAAKDRGVSLQRLLLRALLASSPVLSVVAGASRVPSAVDSAAAATEPWDEQLAAAYAEDVLQGGAAMPR